MSTKFWVEWLLHETNEVTWWRSRVYRAEKIFVTICSRAPTSDVGSFILPLLDAEFDAYASCKEFFRKISKITFLKSNQF